MPLRTSEREKKCYMINDTSAAVVTDLYKFLMQFFPDFVGNQFFLSQERYGKASDGPSMMLL